MLQSKQNSSSIFVVAKIWQPYFCIFASVFKSTLNEKSAQFSGYKEYVLSFSMLNITLERSTTSMLCFHTSIMCFLRLSMFVINVRIQNGAPSTIVLHVYILWDNFSNFYAKIKSFWVILSFYQKKKFKNYVCKLYNRYLVVENLPVNKCAAHLSLK